MLVGSGRRDLAEREFRASPAEDPDCVPSHVQLALCLAERGEIAAAEREARAAVAADPEYEPAHYALASVLHDAGRLTEARAAVAAAVRLDADDPQNHWLAGLIEGDAGDWKAALECAETALRLDPQYVDALNLRAQALLTLGRRDEAFDGLREALARDPENPVTHTGVGWAHVHAGDPARALEHFREALRLDPTIAAARAGILEALKSRNLLYRLALRGLFQIGRLRWTTLVLVCVGIQLGVMMLRKAGGAVPEIQEIQPIADVVSLGWKTITYAAMAAVVMATPISNLLLRLDPLGRRVLTPDECRAGTWCGALLAAAGASAVAGWGLGVGWARGLTEHLALMIVPVAAVYRCVPGLPRRMMIAVAGLLTVWPVLNTIVMIAVVVSALRSALDGDEATVAGLIALAGFLRLAYLAAMLGLRPQTADTGKGPTWECTWNADGCCSPRTGPNWPSPSSARNSPATRRARRRTSPTRCWRCAWPIASSSPAPTRRPAPPSARLPTSRCRMPRWRRCCCAATAWPTPAPRPPRPSGSPPRTRIITSWPAASLTPNAAGRPRWSTPSRGCRWTPSTWGSTTCGRWR
jgi:Tfp pilus assembly protein PilF